MDIKVLKWITEAMVVLTIVVCGMLFVLPRIHEHSVMASEEYYDRLALQAMVEEASTEVVEELEQLPEAIVREEKTVSGLLIQLPDSVSEDQLHFENDYLTQTFSIRIPTNVEDYFSDYKVWGSCDHIAGLNYNCKDGEGVLSISMDKLYEVTTSNEDGRLQLEFIDPHELYDKVIVVDAGHGGKDGGASKAGVYEKNLNLAILLKLKDILEVSQENIGVYYTRTTDKAITLNQRVGMANAANADLFISIHNNASSNGAFSKLHGTEVMYSESQEGQYNSQRFAQICENELTAALTSRKIGLVEGDKIYIIRTSKVPVALLEVGFLTNREELANLQDEEYQKKAAEGIYSAITKAFEEGF